MFSGYYYYSNEHKNTITHFTKKIKLTEGMNFKFKGEYIIYPK